jgi:hypothetical protein
VLPIDSVEEYFQHFQVLEIDFTFYRLLIDQNGQHTQNYQSGASSFSMDLATTFEKTIGQGEWQIF